MAAHTLLETARDALFLARLPPSRLAWVYLAIAVVILGLFVPYNIKNINFLGDNMIFIVQYDKNTTLFL